MASHGVSSIMPSSLRWRGIGAGPGRLLNIKDGPHSYDRTQAGACIMMSPGSKTPGQPQRINLNFIEVEGPSKGAPDQLELAVLAAAPSLPLSWPPRGTIMVPHGVASISTCDRVSLTSVGGPARCAHRAQVSS